MNTKEARLARTKPKPEAPKIPNSFLTTEQEAYCRARAMGMDPKAALDSIQAPDLTIRMVRQWERSNEEVIKRIAQLTEIASQTAILKSGLNRSWILDRLMRIVDRCMQAEPVHDKDGNETGEYRFDASGANRALQMLGSELGMFQPKQEKPGDEYANLSDEDLARIAQELAAQTGLLEAPSGTEATAGSEQIIEVQAIQKAD